MERAVAIKKLTKMLGKSLAWRVNPKAPPREEREAAKAALAGAHAERNKIRDQRDAREKALLAGDPEYQRLAAAYWAAKARADELMSTAHSYKITVGTTSSLFFHVKAEGDSWEDVIAKVAAKDHAPA